MLLLVCLEWELTRHPDSPASVSPLLSFLSSWGLRVRTAAYDLTQHFLMAMGRSSEYVLLSQRAHRAGTSVQQWRAHQARRARRLCRPGVGGKEALVSWASCGRDEDTQLEVQVCFQDPQW